jgi:D-glycero-beta-D-manno-heptose 1-phosphate adenylyltransferase
MSKVLTKATLQTIIQSLHRSGKRIVTTNGSFDILHAGHVYLLEKSRKFGDVLIVGLNSDSSIRRYKGKTRPIIPQRYRALLLSALTVVDYVYVFNELNPIKFLEIVKPAVHVNSAEYGRNCIEAPTVRKYGGKLVLVKKVKNMLSTTEIIARIKRAER